MTGMMVPISIVFLKELIGGLGFLIMIDPHAGHQRLVKAAAVASRTVLSAASVVVGKFSIAARDRYIEVRQLQLSAGSDADIGSESDTLLLAGLSLGVKDILCVASTEATCDLEGVSLFLKEEWAGASTLAKDELVGA